MVNAIVLIIFAFLFIFGAIYNLKKIKKISLLGNQTEGVIFDIETSSTSDNSSITYPIVRFLTNKNEWITQKSTISIIPGFYKKGNNVTIVYDPDNPTIFYVKSTTTYVILIAMLLAGISLIIIGVHKLLI